MEKMAAASLTEREARVVCAVARKTLGYRKPEDTLADAQIARMTGIARTHVAEAVRTLIERGVLGRTGGGRGRIATLRIRLDDDWKPANVHPREDTSTCTHGDTPSSDNVHPPGAEHAPTGVQEPAPPGVHTRVKGVNQQGVDLRVVAGDDARAAKPSFDSPSISDGIELARKTREYADNLRSSLEDGVPGIQVSWHLIELAVHTQDLEAAVKAHLVDPARRKHDETEALLDEITGRAA